MTINEIKKFLRSNSKLKFIFNGFDVTILDENLFVLEWDYFILTSGKRCEIFPILERSKSFSSYFCTGHIDLEKDTYDFNSDTGEIENLTESKLKNYLINLEKTYKEAKIKDKLDTINEDFV
jgi:hypothetical protein